MSAAGISFELVGCSTATFITLVGGIKPDTQRELLTNLAR